MKHSLFGLGCLFVLIINHPSLDGEKFYVKDFESKIFNLSGSRPRFMSHSLIKHRNKSVIGKGDRINTKILNRPGSPPEYFIDEDDLY